MTNSGTSSVYWFIRHWNKYQAQVKGIPIWHKEKEPDGSVNYAKGENTDNSGIVRGSGIQYNVQHSGNYKEHCGYITNVHILTVFPSACLTLTYEMFFCLAMRML